MARALLFGFMLFLISCSGFVPALATQDPLPQGTPVPVTRVGPERSGPRTSFEISTGIEQSLRAVIRDRDAWRDIWKRIHRLYGEVPELPEINFSTEMVVVVALGARPSSGYAIIVDGAYQQQDRLEVAVRIISPRGCMTLAMCTAPVDIVRLPKTDLPVVFRETEVVHECK